MWRVDPRRPGLSRALRIATHFRVAVVVLCGSGALAGWAFGIPELLGLSLVIGGEELLESSVVIAALRDEARRTPA